MAADNGQETHRIVMGYAQGPRNVVGKFGIAASQVFTDTGGKFVKIDGSGHLDLMDDGDTSSFGWADVGAFTASATAGYSKCSVDTSCESRYWIPVETGETATITLRGQKCDIVIASDIQYANTSESTEGTLNIYDVDTVNNLVLVGLNPVYHCQA